MDHTKELPANRDVHNYPGDSNIKVTEMLVVSLCGVNCRFWSHLRCFGMESHYNCPIQVSLSSVHKEIQKKCPDSDKTEISLRNLFKLEPHPYWSPLVV